MPEAGKSFGHSMWPAIVWAILVLILCGLPGDDFPELTFLEWLRPDKIAHLVLFGVQCYLLLKAFSYPAASGNISRNAVWLSLTLTIVYGSVVKILQTYVFIHRSGDLRDAAANALGAFLGLWVYKRRMAKLGIGAGRNS